MRAIVCVSMEWRIKSIMEDQVRKTMSVPEMRRLLGLKKTESYWLVHRNFFKTDVVNGKMRIDIESFEKWYANQVKHKKVTGEEPGKELSKRSYSFTEAANLLGIHASALYEIWNKEGLKTTTVDFVKRIPIEEFESWYESQIMYKKVVKLPTITELESDYIILNDAAILLGITREKLSHIVRNSNFSEYFDSVVFDGKRWISKKSFQMFLNAQTQYQVVSVRAEEDLEILRMIETKEYISRGEAATLAGVSESTITKWAQAEKFTVKGAGRVLRVHREEFLGWMKKYQSEAK